MAVTQIQWPPWEDLINDRFIPLVENRDRVLILYGGRGSSKSDFWSKKLIYRCLTEKYFRYLLIRNEYSTIKESSYQTLKDNIIEMGLESQFEFRTSPLEIICSNGNRFIARGCDDTRKLKSVKDVTGAVFEEDIPSESDFITISSSIRTSKADYLQIIFSVNPEVEGDYTQHWFFQKFFHGKQDLSFRRSTSVDIGKGQTINLSVTAMHSTYVDNKWIPVEFMAEMEDLKVRNPYYYSIYCKGVWGNKVLGGTFFSTFQMGKNTAVTTYNPKLPLIVSFDFNVKPGVSCGIFQKSNNTLYMIDEIQLKSPNNNTSAVCREFCKRYAGHTEGVTYTADASGRQEDTRSEKGHNDIRIIGHELRQFRPKDRTPKANPSVIKSKEFINDVFAGGEEGYKGVRIIIGEHCTKMIADLLYLLEDSDGTALKKKFTDKETGETYEQYGHYGDIIRYAAVLAFPDQFLLKLRGFAGLNITVGKNNIKESRNYYE